MGFVKTIEEIMGNMNETVDFINAEMLVVMWETKPEIVARLLPPPLKPAAHPVAVAIIADYPETNFDVTYQESALFLRAEFEGEEGGYCLSMPVTNDIAMAGGREIYGFPKKIAKIHFEKQGDVVSGWTERRGIRFMEMRAKLTGNINAPDAAHLLAANEENEEGEFSVVSYNFKHFPAPEGAGLDYNPRLVRQETIIRPKVFHLGEAEVELKPSDYDPWAEVEIVRLIGATYTLGNNSMLGGSVIAESNIEEFLPYAFLKWDMK